MEEGTLAVAIPVVVVILVVVVVGILVVVVGILDVAVAILVVVVTLGVVAAAGTQGEEDGVAMAVAVAAHTMEVAEGAASKVVNACTNSA